MINFARQEFNILVKLQLSKAKRIVKDIKATDIFEENNMVYTVFKHKLGDNLKDTVLKLGRINLPEQEVKRCVKEILRNILQLHRLLIKHGSINVKTIHTKKAPGGLEAILGCFDEATIFEHDYRRKRAMSETKPMTSRKFA